MTELDRRTVKRQTPYPRDLAFSKPPGQNIVEFLIVGRDEVGALMRTLEVMAKHKVNLISCNANHSQKSNTFTLTFFADYTSSDAVIDELDREIRSLEFVKEVKWMKMSQSIYDQFLFPITIFDKFRVIVLRATPLLSIEKKMQEKMGSAASSIMFQEGKDYATETTSQQLSMFPGVNPDVLLENNFDGLRATGWGIFEYKKTLDPLKAGGGFEISVTDPPFVSRSGEFFESRFFNGVISGMLEKLYGGTFVISSKSRFDSKNRKMTLEVRREG